MSTTILSDVKIACNANQVSDFDNELIILTNQALTFLAKIGGCDIGVMIDSTTTWEDILTTDSIKPIAVGYITGKVKLLFDPPSSSSAVTAINDGLKEFEWTIQEIVEGRLT